MASSRLHFFLSLFLVYFLAPTIAQLQLLYHDCYVDNAKYITNSTYEANLNHLLNSLANNTSIDYGFYNSSYGQNPDKVYASAICRPDMEPDSCRNCINVASQNLTSVCPNFRMAIGGYDDGRYRNCMLRYAYYDMIGIMENAPYLFVYALSNITKNVEEFKQTRQSLLNRLRSEAAAAGYPKKYATGEEAVSDIVTIYALVQCTPDLTKTQCNDCLIDAYKLMSNCCDTRQGGRVITPSCSFRYETNKFYNSSIEGPSVSSPAPSTNPKTLKGKKNYTVIIVVVSVVTSVILITGVGIILRCRKSEEEDENVEETKNKESLHMDFGTVRIATGNFSDANKLGQGGFGAVYRGILSDGQQVAVKRLSMNSKQGELEFKNEVRLVAKLQHRNLVRLLGFCLEQEERILVYEFVPNSSLDHFIFDPIKREYKGWEKRYKIIEGIARGLLYLHEDSRLRIIHRDLKASNILLDSEMNPKISDFGMAKLFETDQTQNDTKRIVGTFGYMAPEYVKHGRVSVKTDVYSFGVLILEILTGQKRSGFGSEEESEDLLTYAWKSWNEGSTLNLVDPILRDGSTVEMMRCVHIGLLCVQESVSDRPSMASVVAMLNSDFLNLPAPSKPGFFMQSCAKPVTSSSSLEHSSGSGSNNLDQRRIEPLQFSRNEVSITELSPR